MIDIGPRLDSRLRGKFDRIEAEAPPERLMSFQPRAARRRHRLLNAVVGVAAVAVVAEAAPSSHWNSRGMHVRRRRRHPPQRREARSPRCPSSARSPTRTSTKTFRCRPMTRAFRSRGHRGPAHQAHRIGRAARVHPQRVGVHPIRVRWAGTLAARDPRRGGQREPQAVLELDQTRRRADFRCEWPVARCTVALTVVASPLRALGDGRCSGGAADQAPDTAGPACRRPSVGSFDLWKRHRGTSELHAPRHLLMEWWCSGPGGMQVFVSNGNESQGASRCGVSGSGGSDDYTGKRETLVVDVSPANQWEIIVYWQPDQSG